MRSGAAILGVPRSGRRVGGVARGHGAARPEGSAGSHAVAALVAEPALITRVAGALRGTDKPVTIYALRDAPDGAMR